MCGLAFVSTHLIKYYDLEKAKLLVIVLIFWTGESVMTKETWFLCFLQCQVSDSCLSPTNLVVWSGWRVWVQISSWNIQSLLQTSAWQVIKETWTSGLQLWTHPWLGHQTCEVSVNDFWWSTSCFPVLLGESWKLGQLPRRRFCGRKS